MSARVATSPRVCRGFTRAAVSSPQRVYQTRPRRRLFAVSPSTAPLESESDNEIACRLLCPICLKTEFTIRKETRPASLSCDRCRRTFDSNSSFYDLTLSSGEKDTEYTLTTGTGTTVFQSPLVGFVYERGWRQNFAAAGFPGPDKEFESAMEFLKTVTGGSVVDLSCGSGLFTRRFLMSGEFSTVIAVDYSEAMLTQTQQYVDRMQSAHDASLHLIRADVSRLPFPTSSFNAVFAGAAIHCWPNPAMALTEISRLLRPGGIFVMSTFTRLPKELDDLLNRPFLQPLKSFLPARRSRTIMYWDEEALRDTCRLAGLENFESIRNQNYIMARANKPLL